MYSFLIKWRNVNIVVYVYLIVKCNLQVNIGDPDQTPLYAYDTHFSTMTMFGYNLHSQDLTRHKKIRFAFFFFFG